MKTMFFIASAIAIASYGALLLGVPGGDAVATLALEIAGYLGALGTFFAAGAIVTRWAIR